MESSNKKIMTRLPDGYQTGIGENGIYRHMMELQNRSLSWSLQRKLHYVYIHPKP